MTTSKYLIRDTGLNQNGSTTGLTIPSATAQRALIQSTYAKAGIDLTARADCPQYLEAHGSGNPAGGKQPSLPIFPTHTLIIRFASIYPIELEAISSAFFGEQQGTPETGDHPLFMGSTKTVLGHTESTAGISALLKAMPATQDYCITPKFLFNNLGPSVAPFYGNLKILRTA